MMVFAASLLQLALAGSADPSSDNWLVASGGDSCSPSDVDFSNGPSGFAAGSFNCGLVTDDGGLTWSPIRVIPQQGQSLTWAAARTRDELFAARLGLYRSTDRGATWSELGNLSQGLGSILDLHFHDAGGMVAIKGGQIITSEDGGATWTIAYPGEFNINFDELHFLDAATGYATGGVVRSGGNFGTVLRTDDGGQSWDLLTFDYGKITAADFLDKDHGLVATQSEGFFATSDGGVSWEYRMTLPGFGTVTDIGHRGALHWYAVTNLGCLFESFDGGHDWQESYCDRSERALSSLSVKGPAVVAAGQDGLMLYENRIFADGFGE